MTSPNLPVGLSFVIALLDAVIVVFMLVPTISRYVRAVFLVPAFRIPFMGVTGLFFAFVLIIFIIAALTGIFVGSIWMHIWVYALGGRGGWKQTLKALAYGSTPALILGWISLLTGQIPLLGGMLAMIFWAWSFKNVITGIRQLHEISGRRAGAAYLLGIVLGIIVFTTTIIAISAMLPA